VEITVPALNEPANRHTRGLDQADLVACLVKRLHRLAIAGLGLAVDLDRDESVLEELALGLVVLLGVLEVDSRGLAPIVHREQVLGLVDVGFDAGDELALLHEVPGADR